MRNDDGVDELPNPKRIRRGDDLHESLCEIVDPPGHPPTAVSSPGPPLGSRESDGQWLTRRKDKTPRKSSTSSMATAASTAVSTPTAAETAASTPAAATTAAAHEEVKDGEGLFAEMDLSLENEPTAASQTRPPPIDAAVSAADEAHRTPTPSRKVAARAHAAAGEGAGVDIAGAGAGGNGVDFEGEAWTPYSPRSDVSTEVSPWEGRTGWQ